MEDNSMFMPVAPAYGNGGGFGGDGAWWIVLLFLALGGGWGGGFGGGYNGAVTTDFPWVMNGFQGVNANTTSGFDHAATQTALGDLQGAVVGGFGNISNQLYTSQMSDMERSFAAQTATSQGFAGIQSTLCDIRYGNASNTRDIIESQTRGTQTILDKLCQIELDAKNDTISQLRQELMYARGQASQVAQTSAIEASQVAQTQYLVNRISPYPVPAYVVANPVTPATT